MEDIAYTCCTQLKHGNIVRIVTLVEKDKEEISLISVSAKGRVGVYDLALNLRNSFTLRLSAATERRPNIFKGLHSKKKQFDGWITDAVYMEDCSILVVASCERSLHFFTTAVVPFAERFRLYGMKDIPTSLAYTAPNAALAETGPCLVIGDDGGDVFVFYFLKHSQALFKKTEVDDVEQIYWRELHLQAGMVKLSILPGCHNSPIIQVDIKGAMQRVVSCSRNSKNSLAMRHVRGKIAPAFYDCRYGITCFDFDEERGLVVTGSTDAKIRLWSPTNKAKPWLTLSGHTVTLASVWLYNQGSHLWSLCEKPELIQWDLIQGSLLMRLQLNFPTVYTNRKVVRREFSKKPLVYVKSNGVLYIPCGDHIATITIGAEEFDVQTKAKRNSTGIVCDPMTNVEQTIPSYFRQPLLDYGNYEEDDFFHKFVDGLKDSFGESADASKRLGDFEKAETTPHISSASTDTSISDSNSPDVPPRLTAAVPSTVYNWEEEETAIALAPNHLVPMNQIKLREMGRLEEMAKHVRSGTPFCGLQLLEPLDVQLPAGLPVTTRMRKRGIQSIDHLDQVRSMNVDMFSDGILSSLSSARSSLASSVLSYYRHKKVSDKPLVDQLPAVVRSITQLHVSVSQQSSRKSSVDFLSPSSEGSGSEGARSPPL